MAAVSEDAAEVEPEIKLTRLSTEVSEGIVWLSQVSSAATTRSKLHKTPWPRVGRAGVFERCTGTARPTEQQSAGPTNDSVQNVATEEGTKPVSSYYGSDLGGAGAKGDQLWLMARAGLSGRGGWTVLVAVPKKNTAQPRARSEGCSNSG